MFSCKSACRSQSSRSTCSSAELHTAPHCTAPLRHCTACSAVPLQSVDRQTRIAPLCELSTGTRNPKPVPFLRCRPTHSRVNRCHGGLCGRRPTVLRVLCSSLTVYQSSRRGTLTCWAASCAQRCIVPTAQRVRNRNSSRARGNRVAKRSLCAWIRLQKAAAVSMKQSPERAWQGRQAAACLGHSCAAYAMHVNATNTTQSHWSKYRCDCDVHSAERHTCASCIDHERITHKSRTHKSRIKHEWRRINSRLSQRQSAAVHSSRRAGVVLPLLHESKLAQSKRMERKQLTDPPLRSATGGHAT